MAIENMLLLIATKTIQYPIMKPYFRDELFNMQLLRTIANARDEEIGIVECRNTACRIQESDTDSWYKEWMHTASQVAGLAEQYALDGEMTIARQAFLRASDYYRTAYTFLLQQPIEGSLILAYNAQTNTFKKAAALMDTPPLFFSVSYQDIYLPACLYKSGKEESPLLIITGGYDSTIEELYTTHVKAAQEFGYHCLCFEGPGQGMPLIRYHKSFQPDWENVVQKVIDQTILLGNAYTDKIAIMGLAFGGYLALRAASGESRIKACIADAEQYDLYKPVEKIIPGFLRSYIESTNPVKQKLVHALFRQALRHPLRSFTLRRALLVHGASSVEEYLAIISEYNLSGRMEKIQCPVLFCDAEKISSTILTERLGGQAYCAGAYSKITGKKGEIIYREISNPSLFHKRIFNWLAKTIHSPTT